MIADAITRKSKEMQMNEKVKPAMTPTERKEFWFGTELVILEVENSATQYAWRLTVGDETSWTKHYPGILRVKDYAVATAYWEGTLPVMTPFKIVEPEARSANAVRATGDKLE
jgi:hypothetical protein